MVQQEHMANGSGGGDEAWSLFVSYASPDDISPRKGASGWVSQLVSDLQISLARKLGKAGRSIYMDPKLRGGSYISDELKRQVGRSRALLVVASPSYLESGWCQWELDLFRQQDAERNCQRPVFVVETEDISAKLPGGLRDLKANRFWDEDPLSGVRTLAGDPLVDPPDSSTTYGKYLSELVQAVADRLGPQKPHLPSASVEPPTPSPAPPEPDNVPEALQADEDWSDLAVYVYSSPEDREDAGRIAKCLGQLGIEVFTTPVYSPGKTYRDHADDHA